MARPKRPVTRIKSRVVWRILNAMQRTQNWLADETGISRSYLSMLLSHERAPSWPLRTQLQRVLGVEDYDELFYIEYPGNDN